MPRIEPLPAPPGANPLQYSVLAGIMARRPEVLEAFGKLNRTLRFEGLLSLELKESVRRATADKVGCRYCASLGELEPEFADRREALAVALAEAIAEDPKAVTDEQFDELRAEFSDDEIVELVCWICLVTVAGQMFGAVMDVRPATSEEAAAYQDALFSRAGLRPAGAGGAS
jgi:alkylhydroperoxidase family enzyme